MVVPDATEWVSASEIGEYAYCPRAHWYARSRGAEVPEDPRQVAGRSFHERNLGGVRRREERRYAYLAVLALAGAVAAVAAVGI